MSALLKSQLQAILDAEAAAAVTAEGAGLSGMEFGIARSLEEFEALEPEWNSLFARAAASHNLFQSYAWNRTWLRHYLGGSGEPAKIRIATVYARRSGELVLVWPLVMRKSGGLDQLTWMGEPASQYGDLLIDPSADANAVILAAWNSIMHRLAPDVVSLRKVRSDTAIARLVEKLGAHATCETAAPFLDLTRAANFQDYESKFSSKARKNRRRLMRRLSETGRAEFVHYGPGPQAALLTRKAIEMKRAWLDQRGTLATALNDEAMADFFTQFAAYDGPGPQCQVSALELDGAPISIMVAIRNMSRLAGHIFVYDLNHEKAGAGVLLLEELIRKAYEDGLETIDLLAPADRYKLEWADGSVSVNDWAMALSVRGRLYRWIYLEILKGSLKRSAESLPAPVRRGLRHGLSSWKTLIEAGSPRRTSPNPG